MPLFIVASPIGNLDDLSSRAVQTLKVCDLVAAEDTRRTGKLLKAFDIQAKMVSVFDHSERRKTPALIEALGQGKNVALIADAGTPTISDPGFHLVREAIKAGFQVTPIPGPSAVLAALSAAGLPTDRFRFEGFLPRASAKRRETLSALSNEAATTIFFESPARLQASLSDLAQLLPDRSIVVARELTKIHEEFVRGTTFEVAQIFAQREKILGEITLVIQGCSKPPPPKHEDILRHVQVMKSAGLSPGLIKEITAKLLGISKKTVFEVMNRG